MPMSLTFSQPRRAPFSSPSSSLLLLSSKSSKGGTPSVINRASEAMASSGRAHVEDDDESDHDDDAHPNSPVNEAATPSNSSLYGTFSWSVALPSVPADKDSLADISKIRQFSSVFEVGGYEWKLEMYPYGDSQSDKTLSVFLCAVDRKQLPGWSQTAHYQIAVVNNDPSKTSTHTGYDIFRGKRDSAWGWSKLISLGKLHDVAQGWVDEDGKITLQATVHVVTHEYMPVNLTYRKSLCGLYYERVLQSYFEPFLKDELHRLDKLCGNGVLHKGFSDFWTGLQDKKKSDLLKITVHEVLLNVKARLFSRDQPATYLAADVIFKAAHRCNTNALPEEPERSLVGCTCMSIKNGDKAGTVLRLEKLSPEAAADIDNRADGEGGAGTDDGAAGESMVVISTRDGVMRMANTTNFVDVFRAQVSDALDNVRALVKHLKPQTCDGSCIEAMGRHMLAVFAMCGMYITNVHPAYHEKLALQLQEDLIREEEEGNKKKDAKKAKQQEKKKKQNEAKAAKKAEEEAERRAEEESKKKKAEEEALRKRKAEEERARQKAEERRKAQEEAERQRMEELMAAEEEKRLREAERKREREMKDAAERKLQEEREEREEREAEISTAADPAQQQRQQIAAIMRSTELSSVEKQARIQVILAGKHSAAGSKQAFSAPAPPQQQQQQQQQQQHVPFSQNSQQASRGVQAFNEQMQPRVKAPMPTHSMHEAGGSSEPFRPRLGQRSAPPGAGGRGSSIPQWGVGVAGGEDVDVEAYALQMGSPSMGAVDDVMALALGGNSHIDYEGGDTVPAMRHHAMPGYSGFSGPAAGFGGPGGGGGTTGSRLFERWAAPQAQDGNFNGAAGNPLLGHNGSDSEADMSMASTTGSGTRTPQSSDTADGAGGQYASSPGEDGDHDASGPRKQVAMLVGYVGSEFSSFDCGSGAARTVEGEVIKALRKSGAVSSSDSLERIGWSRSACSFEGEHASCQSVAFDCVSFRSSMQSFTDRLNSRLPPDVRILNTAPCGHEPSAAAGPQPPAKKRYHASGDATSVTFDYCVPSAFLAPIPESVLRGGPQALLKHCSSFTMTKKQEKSVNALLRLYITGGTKGHPWNAAKWEFRNFVDPSHADSEYGGNTMRSVKSAQCGRRPVSGGVEHVSLQFEGSDFMRGQIRRMAGLVIMLIQGRNRGRPEDIIAAALRGDPNIQPPLAPAHSVILERPSYPADKAAALPKEGWSDNYSKQQMESFRSRVLMPLVGSPQGLQASCQWMLMLHEATQFGG